MGLRTYKVERGDTLWGICREHGSSIAGNSIQEKINTLVRLNGIANPNLIIVGQVLTLSEGGGSSSGSSSSSSSSSSAPTAVTIKLFGLQAQDTSGRAMYVTWSWSRANTSHYTVRWRYYADGVWWIGNESDTTSHESEYCQSTYNAPSNAKKVRVSIKPISTTYKEKVNDETVEKNHWTLGWGAEKEYDFANNPPSVPDTPDVKIEELTLTASIDNIDSEEINATTIEFEIVKDNVTKFKSGKANINANTNYVSYSCAVDPGSDYKVRCRAVRGSLTSSWSAYSGNSGTKPAAVTSGITTCRANKYDNNGDGEQETVTVYLEWGAVSNADTYDIEYTTNKAYFDKTDQTTTKTGIEFTNYELVGLTLGHEYFFRVRAVNQNGESDWSEIRSIVIGIKPAAPTTWSSTTTATVGEKVTLYWVHNSEDESIQTWAVLYITAGESTQSMEIKNENGDKTSFYELDTSKYPEGTKLLWSVQTAGISNDFGEMSIQRTIDIYAQPTLEMSVTDLSGTLIDTLTSFPFYISALAGPNTQVPIGYQVKITANEFYETIDETGRTKMVNEGEAVYSKYFDVNTKLLLEMTAGTIDLESGITYKVTCVVTMNSGLSAEISHEFKVSWAEQSYLLDADISIDPDTLTASIRPICKNNVGVLIDDVTLAVYRREFDGTFTQLAKGLNNSNNTYITDPHPALNYARYRVVATENATGAVTYYDVPGYPVGGKAVIIQWDENWTQFDASDEYSIDRPAWSGSILRLPYNVDVSDSNTKDVTLVKYQGREHPVSYYGTQKGVSSSWSVEIEKSDAETIYALRRLAIWPGDVYVREPSGSGYWASIDVSFSQKHRELTIPVSFNITRVEGGI